MFNRQLVLVAIDHGTDVERTIDVALRTARKRDADVHVIQVAPHGAMPVDDRLGENIGARLASILRSAGHDGVHVQRVTLRGAPEHVIPAYAQLYRAAILVVDRDYGSSRFWRNSRVVDEVARQSPIPLLVLPKRQRDEDATGLRRILTPVDFSIASAVALRTAFDLARRDRARLTLVHALKDLPRHTVLSGGEAWKVVRRLPARLDAVADRLRRKAAVVGADDVGTEVATGDADRAILEVAARSDADLIVMGIAHRSWLDRLMFGSILRRVLRRAPVPVLVVPVVAGGQAWPDGNRVWREPAADRVAA